jgi:hypothetical protein
MRVPTMTMRAWMSALWLAACAACSQADRDPTVDAGGGAAGNAGSSETDRDASGPRAGNGGAGDAGATRPLVGNFEVEMIAEKGSRAAHTKLTGQLYDAPKLPLVPLVLDSEEGDCRLMVPYVPFCDPQCDEGECTADDTCTPIAMPQSVGTVRVLGLGEELVLEPFSSALTYMPAQSLPYPPCTEGDAVRVEADAFALQTACIAPLVVTGEDPIPVRADQPVAVTWTAGSEASARVRIVLDIAHHGGQKGEIDCDVADDGAFELPEPLVTKLVGLGLAGFPTVVISRVSAANADTHPELTLSIVSKIERGVDTGVVSCGSDVDCPDGMTCDMSTLICVE